MAKRDYYELLGVQRDADAETIKRAYRKLAMQYHPDRNPGDAAAEQRFKEAAAAYDILKDDQKRAAYDRFGAAAFEQGGPRAGNGGGFEFSFGEGFSDIFDEMFGEFMGQRRGGGGAGTARGNDLRYNLTITLEQAFAGANVTIAVPGHLACETCNGSGAAPGSKPITCPTCQGAGRVRAQQGFFTVERTCHSCGGHGRVIERPCPACRGAGHIQKEKTLSVAVPAGIEENTRIRVAGEGEAGMRGGTPGDLYIFISISPHALFQREGAHIHCRVPIPMTVAALGGSVEVPVIDGSRTKLTIPEGTQTGQQFRLRAKGMSILKNPSRGDMYVTATVETPVNLSRQQQELLRQFEDPEASGKTSPQSEGFFARVRELWDDLRE